MKTQSQTIADLIAFNDKEHLFHPEYDAAKEILDAVIMLCGFIFVMAVIMFVGALVY